MKQFEEKKTNIKIFNFSSKHKVLVELKFLMSQQYERGGSSKDETFKIIVIMLCLSDF